VRTARTWRLPPTVLQGLRKEDGTFNYQDRILALAVQRFEDSLCPDCGLPASVAKGDHNVGRIEVNEGDMCHGCVAVEEHRADKSRQSYPGQKHYLKIDWD